MWTQHLARTLAMANAAPYVRKVCKSLFKTVSNVRLVLLAITLAFHVSPVV